MHSPSRGLCASWAFAARERGSTYALLESVCGCSVPGLRCSWLCSLEMRDLREPPFVYMVDEERNNMTTRSFELIDGGVEPLCWLPSASLNQLARASPAILHMLHLFCFSNHHLSLSLAPLPPSSYTSQSQLHAYIHAPPPDDASRLHALTVLSRSPDHPHARAPCSAANRSTLVAAVSHLVSRSTGEK